MQVLISYILVNYRTAHLVKQCIASIRLHTSLPYEVIVVDNASGDDCQSVVDNEPNCIYIQNSANVGFGTANNVGAKKAKGSYLFFLNSDTYLLSDATAAFYQFMERAENANIGCCGGCLVNDAMGKQVSHGNFPSVAEVFSQLGFYRLYETYYRRRLSSSSLCDGDNEEVVDYISGADMFIRASVFQEIGGFDEHFFLYFEEVELSYRLKKKGYCSAILPKVRIVHLEGGSNPSEVRWNEAKVTYFERSRQLYFRKTEGIFSALAVKIMLCLQALCRWAYHRDGYYLKVFRILAKA